jgi:hypothetical protein
MARIEFLLEEQAADMRSFEFAYRFKVQNNGASAINLLAATPRLAKGIELLEVKSSTALVVTQRHDELCGELTEILKDYLTLTSEQYRTKLAEAQIQVNRQVLGGFGAIWRLYFSMLVPSQRRRLFASMKLALDKLKVKITNLRDAQDAFNRFIANAPENVVVVKEVFEAKISQLVEVESQEGSAKGPYLARIEPDSFYAATYVLKYQRRLLEPRRYTASIEATYQEVGKTEIMTGSSSAGAIVSPNPLVLTIFAIVAGMLGAALKYSLLSGDKFKWYDLNSYLFASSSGIAAMIFAAVLFNVYEYTDWGKRISIAVGWRSALLIGVLSGLFGDRVLSALKAFTEAPK